MAFIRYVPEPGTPEVASQFGVEFGPEPVVVNNPRIIAKCEGSPFYVVTTEAPEAQPVIGLRAIHNGGPRFIIVRGDKDQKVKDGLTKADADAFNALSDEDKAAYVAD